MLVFLQRLWVMIVVDGFLLYIIIRLLREKTEVKKKEKKVGPAPKPEKYIGRLLDYEFRDEHGRTQSGSIKEYPCLLGRGRNCDTKIVETEKNGHYFLAREFIQITETADGFRVTRCKKNQRKQELISGTVDGKRFKDEISMTFKWKIIIEITPFMTLELEKHRRRTSTMTR